MLKIILLFFFITSSHTISISQKHDQNWLLGFDWVLSMDDLRNNHIDFSKNPLEVKDRPSKCVFALSVNISISDVDGNLIFYSDGCKIVGADNSLLENGDSLNPGDYANDCEFGYPGIQGGIVLTSPEKNNEFDFITYRFGDTQFGGRSVYLLGHHINFINNTGIVTSKNESIIQDSFSNSNLTACKHANGEGWWILAPKMQSNSYFTILLDKEGYSIKAKQSIGPIYNYDTDWCGQSVFSPDGKKYARFDRGNDLTIFDFDRCDGSLSNPIHIPVIDQADSLYLGCGLAYSANSRFLYAMSCFRIYQYDMWATDIPASEIIVVDIEKDSVGGNFFIAQLAPNDKIYICSAGSIYALHVIDQPDLPGIACNFKKYDLKMIYQVGSTLPNFPNYRLGPMECDTSSAVSEISENNLFKLSPNPVINNITCSWPENIRTKSLSIINLFGETLNTFDIQSNVCQTQLSTMNLVPAMYYLIIELEDGKKFAAKFIKN